MKKILISLFISGMILGIASSCGEAYKPMTTEQLEAKVDSLYKVQAAELEAEMMSACDSLLEENVTARMEELKNQ